MKSRHVKELKQGIRHGFIILWLTLFRGGKGVKGGFLPLFCDTVYCGPKHPRDRNLMVFVCVYVCLLMGVII